MRYDFKNIEAKWQEEWEKAGIFHASEDHTKPKFYGLVEFPYPSGAGMHVGHIKAYSGLEVVSRKGRCSPAYVFYGKLRYQVQYTSPHTYGQKH